MNDNINVIAGARAIRQSIDGAYAEDTIKPYKNGKWLSS